jgi:hypothetical protein
VTTGRNFPNFNLQSDRGTGDVASDSTGITLRPASVHLKGDLLLQGAAEGLPEEGGGQKQGHGPHLFPLPAPLALTGTEKVGLQIHASRP